MLAIPKCWPSFEQTGGTARKQCDQYDYDQGPGGLPSRLPPCVDTDMETRAQLHQCLQSDVAEKGEVTEVLRKNNGE